MWLPSAGVIGVQGVLTALLIGVLTLLLHELPLWLFGGRPLRLPALPPAEGVLGRFIPEEVLETCAADRGTKFG